MLDSDAPSKIPILWARDGARNTIPSTSQRTITLGAASWPDGFPPETMIPLAAGGAAPFGQDFNGVLNPLSAWARWQAAGGPVYYDGTFAAAIGGYPLDSAVVATDHSGFWISTVDANTTNPDAGGAGWRKLSFNGSLNGMQLFATAGGSSWAVPAGVTRVRVRLWGGGGGGGGSRGVSSGGSGGGGGGYAEGQYTVTPGASVSITVGAGGAPGTGDSGVPTNGSPGGTTSFGAFCSATGGFGGAPGDGFINRGGVPLGGSGIGGTINFTGANGGYAFLVESGTATCAATAGASFGFPTMIGVSSVFAPGFSGAGNHWYGFAGGGGINGGGGGTGVAGAVVVEF